MVPAPHCCYQGLLHHRIALLVVQIHLKIDEHLHYLDQYLLHLLVVSHVAALFHVFLASPDLRPVFVTELKELR